jgi:hypothetical protein
MQHLLSPDPNTPPLATRIQTEGNDTTYRVTPAGRKVYGKAKVILLSVSLRGVDVHKVL